MAKKIDEGKKDKERVEGVLDLLKKQAPLTLKQEKFCSNGCVERFLRAEGDNVKKAAKHLRNCLSWRNSFCTEHLMADEFCAELAEGVAYLAGHDHQSRPVMIFRAKQDYQKFHSQKSFTRLLVFTLEVAIQTMPKNVEQFVLLFDASFFRSASAFMNMLLAALKIVGYNYPGQLHKAFIIDPPSLFSYLWKGVKSFVELSSSIVMVSSLDYEESLHYKDLMMSYPRATSLRFDPSIVPSSSKLGSCSSSRFAFTVSSNQSDSIKPWYLSLTEAPNPKIDLKSNSHAFLGSKISPLNARSLSFASPMTRSLPPNENNIDIIKKGFFPSTPMPEKSQKIDPSMIHHPRTPKPSFFQSPSLFFRKKGCELSRVEKTRESFLPYLKFYRRPYDEMTYRSKMKPPLGGLVSIISPHLKRRNVYSVSQRF